MVISGVFLVQTVAFGATGTPPESKDVAFAAVLIFCLECADSNDKILLSGSNIISFCYRGFHIGIYKSCLMFYNGVESNGFIGFGAVVARRRDMCR
ncbi:MAG: hypothetical protein KIG73_00120 [Alphaproteobacteria bacterium]|nr:hypothetical protein [Alphaproteobacteria bacterium]